jgi:MFS family permease
MRFFTSAPFAGAAAIAVCLSVTLGGFLFVSTLYLQGARGFSALRAGVYMLPTAAAIIVFAPISGRLTGRFGARPSMVGGGLLVMASGLMLTALDPNTSVAYLLGAYAIFGVGFALTSPPIANTAVAGMPAAQAGVASAVATTSRQVGITVGVAVLGTIVGTGLNSQITSAFAHATHPGWWVIAALGLTVAVVGWLTTTTWAHNTVQRTAERFSEPRLALREPTPPQNQVP